MSRGSPCTATACPPTIRKFTFAEISARKNSLHSSYSGGAEPCAAERFDAGEALFGRGLREVFFVERFGVFEGGDTQDLLDGHG